MVKGLVKFTEHFAGHEDQYVLIGGTAMVLALEEVDIPTRGTKDLDIVLSLEVLDPAFVAAFWAFVREGDYEVKERSDSDRTFYRFRRPKTDGFPEMLELFSRKPDALTVPGGQVIVPIKAGEEAESLSAILLDEDYYRFLHARKEMIRGVPVVDSPGLIALKAHAWVQLSAARDAGQEVDRSKINKHRADVLRLSQMLAPSTRVPVPAKILAEIEQLLAGIDPAAVNLKQLEIAGTLDEAIDRIRAAFQVEGA